MKSALFGFLIIQLNAIKEGWLNEQIISPIKR